MQRNISRSMHTTTTSQKSRRRVNSLLPCHECNAEAFGRCPDCSNRFCLDHFPKRQHSPCTEKQMRLAIEQACSICGAQVHPDQWSAAQTSHYIDQGTCHSCGRYICDALHTRLKTEEVVAIREGLRGHRYQYILRYCDVCYPFQGVGGIKRFAQAVVVLGTIAGGIFFYLHP
jgi:hypothetical protein